MLRIPHRFDTHYVAYTQLHEELARLAAFLPWHPSLVFYYGPIDPWHIGLTAAGFVALSFLCFSARGARMSKAAFFLVLLGLTTGLTLFANRG